jgi:hypothetical protein
MALGDLPAEQQVLLALLTSREALGKNDLSNAERERALAEIREAIKRIEEAWGEYRS